MNAAASTKRDEKKLDSVMAIPSFSTYRKAYTLRSAAEDFMSQLPLARQKAISTDSLQTFHVEAGYQGSDYHIHNGSVVGPKWSLPSGVSYGTGTGSTFRFDVNGRCLDSGLIVLQDTRGVKDTISVLNSGLILLR